jgi:hypothetical protein
MMTSLTHITPAEAPEGATPRIAVERRRQLFASAIQAQLATGGRVKSEGEFEAVIVRRVRPRRG